MLKDKLSALKDMLRGRVVAYNHVFSRDNLNAQKVLADLAKFCRAHESTFHSDPRVHAVLEGRREVWLRIQQQLNLDLEEIYELYKLNE